MTPRLFYGTLTVAPPGSAALDGATFLEAAQTAPRYRLFDLDGFPVLVESPQGGAALSVQVWEVPEERWREIVASEPPEMRPAAVELDDGRTVGTLVGPLAWVEARRGVEATAHGSWAAYVRGAG